VEENSMKKQWLTMMALAIALFAVSNTAKADASTCVDSSSVDCYTLGFQNGALSGTGPWGYVEVSVNGGGTQVTIEFTAASGFQFHNNGVGWDTANGTSITSIVLTSMSGNGGLTLGDLSLGTPSSGTDQCPPPNGNGANFDGFGDMSYNVCGGSGSSTGFTDVVITIGGTDLTLADFEVANGDGQHFTAQVAPYPNPTGKCTGFVADVGPNGSDSPAAGCGTVPEPGSLVLFGSGLLGIAGFLRRKLMA
jgi:PEP-CTERM motif-containing protein